MTEQLAVIPPPSGSSPTNRVVVRTDVIHCPDGLDMKCLGKPYSYLIDSRDQAYERVVMATAEWQPLSFGWVPDPSLLFVKNLTTDEGHDVDLAYKVSWGFVAVTIVRAGRDCHFEPTHPEVHARCRLGDAKLHVAALPR